MPKPDWSQPVVERPELAHLMCPLTPDQNCIRWNDGLCCHSSSPTECAYDLHDGEGGMCLAHESLTGDWLIGTLEAATRDNGFAPAVVCHHPAHVPYRQQLADWVANGYTHTRPDKQHWDSTNSEAYGWALDMVEQTNKRVLWAHHYNDFCPAWPFSEGHTEAKIAARAARGE